MRDFAGSLRASWREALLVAVSVVATLAVAEAGYRLYRYWTLPGRLFAIISAVIPKDYDPRSALGTNRQYMPDAYTGYLYSPNYEGRRGPPWNNRWRTNSHGHVSKFEYPRQKPPGEFRIGVVGDSMTANVTNSVRWTEVLEEDLNASEPWRARVGGKLTRVINFGVDGMGMVQFAAMVRHHVLGFEPDLIIVNFISADILRRVRYFDVPGPTRSREESIRVFVKTNYLDRIDWLSSCPELYAAIVRPKWASRCWLPLDAEQVMATGPSSQFATRKEAMAASKAAVSDAMAAFGKVVFLQMPQYHELQNQDLAEWRGLADELRTSVPQANFVSLRPQMDALLDGKRVKDRPELADLSLHQIMALPEEKRAEIYRWFFLPDDVHFTDYGTTLYAHEVAKLLIGAPPAK